VDIIGRVAVGTYADLVKQLLPGEETHFGGGVPETEIDAAEQTLGIRFPSTFRAFLKELGCGGISSEEFIGLGGPPHLNVVESTHLLRGRPFGFPMNLIPLRGDGFANFDCLELDCWTGDECPVVEWVHDAPNMERRLLAPNYERWFASILQLIVEIDREEEERRG
jgi:hypothetical protein